MIDGSFCSALQAALSEALPGIFVGEPQDDQPIPAKAVLLDLQTEVVVGSALQRGTLTLHVVSQADDYTKLQHSDFVQDVDFATRTLNLDSDDVALYGVVAQSTNNLREERHWRTVLPYIVGFGPKS
jgi:hypothetical protein